jgi:hypothetical protein
LRSIYEWVGQLRSELPLAGVVDAVSQRMRTGDSKDQYDLALYFVGLLEEAGRYREALPILDEMIDRFPDDIRFPIGKATLYLYFLGSSGNRVGDFEGS